MNGVVCEGMSKEAPIGLTFMEKLVGLLLIVVGALWFYTTYTNIGSLYPQSVFFLGVAFAMIILGIVLFIAKSE
jgi:hypothetical protein